MTKKQPIKYGPMIASVLAVCLFFAVSISAIRLMYIDTVNTIQEYAKEHVLGDKSLAIVTVPIFQIVKQPVIVADQEQFPVGDKVWYVNDNGSISNSGRLNSVTFIAGSNPTYQLELWGTRDGDCVEEDSEGYCEEFQKISGWYDSYTTEKISTTKQGLLDQLAK